MASGNQNLPPPGLSRLCSWTGVWRSVSHTLRKAHLMLGTAIPPGFRRITSTPLCKSGKPGALASVLMVTFSFVPQMGRRKQTLPFHSMGLQRNLNICIYWHILLIVYANGLIIFIVALSYRYMMYFSYILSAPPFSVFKLRALFYTYGCFACTCLCNTYVQ